MRTRSWRRYQKQKVIERRLKKLRQLDWVFNDGPQFIRRHEPLYAKLLRLRNSLGKTHALGCRTTRCSLCHFEKFWQGRARRTEKLKAIEFELQGVA